MGPRFPSSVVLASVVALVAFGWLLLAALPRDVPNSLIDSLTVGLVIGTIFGQASLAGAWCALGPLPLVRRLPLSFAWLGAIVVSFGCNIARTPTPNGLGVLLVYGGAVVGQWLLVQTPIWIFVVKYGLRVANYDDVHLPVRRRDQQFGIRQVMILTTLVAVVLGVGRLLLGGLKTEDAFNDLREVFGFAFSHVPTPSSLFHLLPPYFWLEEHCSRRASRSCSRHLPRPLNCRFCRC